MARKTPAETARTRRRILEAASEVFSRDGIANATLEQIARQAGVTRGAIYWHYKGKQDLLQALFGEQKLPLEYPLPEDVGLEAGWQLLHQALLETVNTDTPRRLSEIMLYQGACATDSAAAHRRLLQARERFMGQLEVLLNRAVARQDLSPALDVRALKDFFQACITGLLYECLQNSANRVQAISSTLDTLLSVARQPPPHLLVAGTGRPGGQGKPAASTTDKKGEPSGSPRQGLNQQSRRALRRD